METSRRRDRTAAFPDRPGRGVEGDYARAQALTEPGETVLWAGAPEHAVRAAHAALPDAAAGALLLAAAGALARMLFGGAGGATPDAPSSPLTLVLLACLCAAGALLTAAPLMRARGARDTLYVVTDRRVLLCRGGAGRRTVEVEPLTPPPTLPHRG